LFPFAEANRREANKALTNEPRRFYGIASDAVFGRLADAGLRVSSLQDYVQGGQSLTRAGMVRQVEDGLDFYFVAHP